MPGLAAPRGVVQVIDADTWDVGGQRTRIFGIDAPEQDQTCTQSDGSVWACGVWATDQARKRYQGKEARCDTVDTDRYGRSVARCIIDDQDVGQALVSDGVALAYRRYAMDCDLDEKVAAVTGRGLHVGGFQAPSDYRAARAKETHAANPTCAIKGNVASDGTRIYHMPGQTHYGRTRISAAKGERWFCSQAQARAAGWRPARR